MDDVAEVHRVLVHLCIGNDRAAASSSLLKKHDITRLLSCDEGIVYTHPNVQSRRVHIIDVPTDIASPFPQIGPRVVPTDLFEALPTCFDFIDQPDDETTVYRPRTLIYSTKYVFSRLFTFYQRNTLIIFFKQRMPISHSNYGIFSHC